MRYVICAALAVLLSTGVLAQDSKNEPEKPTETPKKDTGKEAKPEKKAKQLTDAEVKKKLEKKLNVSFEDQTAATILQSIAKSAGVELVLAEGVTADDELSLDLKEVKASAMLTIVCDSCGLVWEVKDGKVVIKADE